MSDPNVTLRFSQEGADSLRAELEAVRAALAATPPTVDTLSAALQRLMAIQAQLATQQQRVAASSASMATQLSAARNAFLQGQSAGSGFMGTLGLIGTAASSLSAPLILVGLGLGVVVNKLREASAEAAQTYRELRQLQAVSGLSFGEAGALKGAFERAGVNDQSLVFALNRVGFEAEINRASFERMGISIEGAGGRAKNAGQLFLELHDRINQLTDANERNDARRTFFGRAGAGELAPIFDLSSQQLAGMIEKSREFSNLSPELVARMKALTVAQAEVRDRQREVSLAFGETIALPVERWFTDVLLAAQKLMQQGVRAPGIRALTPTWLKPSEEMARLTEEEDRAAKLFDRAEEYQKRRVEGGGRETLSPDQARLAEAQARTQTEQQATLLTSETNFQAALSQLRTDGNEEAVQGQIALNQRLIRLAGERFEALLDVERKRSATGAVPTEVINKLVKELADTVGASEDKIKQLSVEAIRARVQAEERRVTDSIARERNASEQRLAIIEQSSQRELALIRTSSQSEIAITLETARVELETAQKVTAEKLRQNEIEAQATADLAVKKRGMGVSDRPEILKLGDLATQRIRAEQEMATKVVAARTKMVDDLDRLARREAQIGQQAIDLAQRRLEAEQRAAAGPLRGEAARLQREAEQESMQAERERLGTIEDPTELRNARRQLRVRELQAQAEAIENQPIYLDQEGIKAALNRMYQAAAEGFARLASGGSILGTPGAGTEGQAPELEGIRAMAQFRAAMAELGTVAPGLADLQQLASALQGLKEKFMPTAVQGGAAFPAGSFGATLQSAPPVDSVLARLLTTSGVPGAGAPNVPIVPAAIGGPGPATESQLDQASAAWKQSSEAAKSAGQTMTDSLKAFLDRIRSASGEGAPGQRGPAIVSPGGGFYNRSSFGGPNDGSSGIGSRPGGGGNVSSMGLGGPGGSGAPSGGYEPSQLAARSGGGGGGANIMGTVAGYDPWGAARTAEAAYRQAVAAAQQARDAVAIAESEGALRIAAAEARYARETNPARAGEAPTAQPGAQPYAGVPPPVSPGAVSPGSPSGAFPAAEVTASMMAAAEKFAAAVERFASVNPESKPTAPSAPGRGVDPSAPLVEGANALGAAYAAAFASATSAADGFIESMRGKLTEAQRDVIESLYREIKERMYSDMAWDAARK